MTKPSYEIRQAVAGDGQKLFKLFYELGVYEKIEDEITVTAEDIEREFFRPNPPVEAFFAIVDGKEVGVATLYYNYATFQCRKGCYLEDLFVSPDYRKQGLGKALIRAVAQRAVESKCARMEWIALEWNENALNFYRSLGSEVLDDWRMLRLEQPHLDKLTE